MHPKLEKLTSTFKNMRLFRFAILGLIMLPSLSLLAQVSQEPIFTKKIVGFKVQKMEQDYAPDKAYNKLTGERVSKEEYDRYLEHYKGIMLEAEYDKYGNISKHYINWEDPKDFPSITIGKNFENGDLFPEFVFNTVDGNKLSSADLKGRKVLLIFYPNLLPKSNPSALCKRMDANIEFAKSEVEKIIIMKPVEVNVDSLIQQIDDSYHIVTDTRNFFYRYNIVASPMTYLLDEEGIVIFRFNGLHDKGIYQALQK